MTEANAKANIYSNRPILAIEDSNEDFETFTRIVKSLGFTGSIYRAYDGDDALDFLYHEGEYEDEALAPRPVLIVIDLNLPGTDGREVIEKIKRNEDLKKIPIVVFTTSSSTKDIDTCYRYGANSYTIKPIGTEALTKTIRSILDYWFNTVILPNGGQK